MRAMPVRRHALLAALFLVTACATPGAAEESLLKSVVFRLPGTWQGDGNFGGMAAKVDLTWATAFDGQFLRVHMYSKFKNKEGTDLFFEGEGTIVGAPDGAGRREGAWFDSQGKRHSLVAISAGDSLVTDWVDPDGARGRMVYKLLDGTTMEVRDERFRNDNWLTFTISKLSRMPATPH